MVTINQELYSSKNHKQLFRNRTTGKIFIAKSTAALASEKTLLAELLQKKQEFSREMAGLQSPFYCIFKIYRKNRRRFDYINIVQELMDCMTKVGIICDDNADVLIPAFEPYEIDSKNPRVDIKFAPIDKYTK